MSVHDYWIFFRFPLATLVMTPNNFSNSSSRSYQSMCIQRVGENLVSYQMNHHSTLITVIREDFYFIMYQMAINSFKCIINFINRSILGFLIMCKAFEHILEANLILNWYLFIENMGAQKVKQDKRRSNLIIAWAQAYLQ